MPTSTAPGAQLPDRNLAMELVRVTESAALAASKVYVANETDGTVSVIATDTRQTVRTSEDGKPVVVRQQPKQAPRSARKKK